jgi:hypothetical protein
MNTQHTHQWLRQSVIASLSTVTIATALFSFTPVAQARRCRTIAQHWDGSVDMRSSPQYNLFNLMGNVPNGTELDVIGERDNWLEIYIPDNPFRSNEVTGWVAANQTRRICFRDNRSRLDNSSDYDSDYDEQNNVAKIKG